MSDSRDTPDARRIALVTGANRGIGRAIAEQLATMGMTVLLGARDPRQGEDAAAAIKGAGGDAYAIALDVTDQASVQAAAARVEQGFDRLDVLINNAGISGTIGQPPSTADLDNVRAVFDTNVFGVIRVTNAMLPLLRRSAAARIVNVTSGLGSLARMSDPGDYLAGLPAAAAYVPAKTALNSLTVQYAKELRAANILVNAADPGPCATDFTKPLGLTIDRTAADGAVIAVRLATLGADGPTGRVFNEAGPVPW
jgi:NAD(P)-dependent dehydrogenase (short-subunit alcohol dehydrogenase family)